MSKQNELAQLADAVTVDGSNVGIGVVPKTWNVYDQAVQIGDGAAIWTYQNAEAHYSVNSYYNSGNKYIGTGTALQYQQAAGAHSFKTATSGTADAAISWNTKVSIDSDGLKFNGDTTAANALSDYEEGTWTPILRFGSGYTSSYSEQIGTYTKIGRAVTISFRIVIGTKGPHTGAITVNGLPFTVANTGVYPAAHGLHHNINSGSGSSVSGQLPVTQFFANQTYGGLYASNSGGSPTPVNQAYVSNGSVLNGTVTYQTS